MAPNGEHGACTSKSDDGHIRCVLCTVVNLPPVVEVRLHHGVLLGRENLGACTSKQQLSDTLKISATQLAHKQFGDSQHGVGEGVK